MADYQETKNKYLKEKVEEFKIYVPKGEKARIKAHALSVSKSLNAYVVGLINADMAANKKAPSEDGAVEVTNIIPLAGTETEPSNVAPLHSPLVSGRKIPVLGRIPAGIPIQAVEDVIDEIPLAPDFSFDGRNYFGLLVCGNSMYPEYMDGDYVIIREQQTADTGDDVVAYIGEDDATLKRLHRSLDGIELRPLNNGYQTFHFSNQAIRETPVTIAGIVVEQIRNKRPQGYTSPIVALGNPDEDELKRREKELEDNAQNGET